MLLLSGQELLALGRPYQLVQRGAKVTLFDLGDLGTLDPAPEVKLALSAEPMEMNEIYNSHGGRSF
ncbi:hypothetical protein D5R40_33630 [Okeania hirsuta]|uniref:Uncharacterized protein n=1 Tax=Okeania hirsuta TaxID=1458930 RepID=A0A3N6P3X6_9CYAN|nr:hypothetical protein D5R40_33630 [Okeania hirsuta]